MHILLGIVSIAVYYASVVASAAATYSPIADIKYAVAVPQSTVDSGSGHIYFQITAPTSYQWVAIGIGQQMAGATIFIMYADGKGNVTISPRAGIAEVMPQYSSTIAGVTTLLAGSGVNNGTMTANVRYTSSTSTLQVTSSSANWIGAWKSGDALDSTNAAASINKHDAHAQYTFDMTRAVISSDSNPFVDPSSLSNIPTTGSLPPTSSVAATQTPARPSSGPSSLDGISSSTSNIEKYQKAHGTIMAMTVVVLIPLGTIAMRVGLGVWVHAALQLFSYALLITGLGLGVHLAQLLDILYKSAGTTHTIFGTVIIGLFLIQPFLGLLQHFHSRHSDNNRSAYGYAHVWYGRILMLLAVINGGLGLQLAANSRGGKIAYGVIAGIIGLTYTSMVVLRRRSTKRKPKDLHSVGGGVNSETEMTTTSHPSPGTGVEG